MGVTCAGAKSSRNGASGRMSSRLVVIGASWAGTTLGRCSATRTGTLGRGTVGNCARAVDASSTRSANGIPFICASPLRQTPSHLEVARRA